MKRWIWILAVPYLVKPLNDTQFLLMHNDNQLDFVWGRISETITMV